MRTQAFQSWWCRGQKIQPHNSHPDKRSRLVNAPREGIEQGRAGGRIERDATHPQFVTTVARAVSEP
eukprot:9473647-Pyramimonas_sp.AAC.1